MAEVIRGANVSQEHPVLEATEARGARWGLHVFWILVVSIALAAIVLFGSWALRSGDLAKADATETPSAQQVVPPVQAPIATPATGAEPSSLPK